LACQWLAGGAEERRGSRHTEPSEAVEGLLPVSRLLCLMGEGVGGRCKWHA